MSEFIIRSAEQARAIVAAYHECGDCSECPIDMPEGWCCNYVYERALAYLAAHGGD